MKSNHHAKTRRRTFLKATGAAGAIVGTAGCLGWLRGGDGDGDAEQNEEPSVEEGEPPTKNDTSEPAPEENTTENESTNESTEENQSEEMPEAANPEPADNSPNESAYGGNESQAREPTTGDIEVTSHELKTDASGATVEAKFTNVWHDTIEVLDVEVAFLKNGKQVTSVVWGTNDLKPGGQWSYSFRAEGEEYSSVDNYEIYVVNIQ